MNFIKRLIILLALFPYQLFGQSIGKVDTSNYYSLYSKGEGLLGSTLTTAWLTYSEVLTVLKDELKNAGYQDIRENQLYQIPKSFILLAEYLPNEDFGFLYCEGHIAPPEKESRNQRSRFLSLSGNEYFQGYYSQGAVHHSIAVKKLPSNIFILQEDVYWYQFTDDTIDNSKLVTKEVITQILRQDIRTRLQQAPKPNVSRN